METRLREAIKNERDHVLIIDIGLDRSAKLAVESIGKSFKTLEREAVVI